MNTSTDRIERSAVVALASHAVDPQVDYSSEPTTLVEFRLDDAVGGTLLTLVESGFDQIPPERRMSAFRGNSGGWEIQMQNIDKHVAAS